MPKRVDHPIILGIVGDSALGKTTLSAGVAQILGEEHCSVFCTDDYHRYTRQERNDAGLSALDPRANYIDVLEQHLRLLRRGEAVLKPVYCHADGTLGRPKYFKPTEFVIAEGLLGYTTGPCGLLRREDLSRSGGRSPDQMEDPSRYDASAATAWRKWFPRLERRKQDSPNFIHPQRTFADIVIRFLSPKGANGSDTQLDVRHLLRPTLPHPDFTPLFDGSSNAGLHLELVRDRTESP